MCYLLDVGVMTVTPDQLCVLLSQQHTKVDAEEVSTVMVPIAILYEMDKCGER